jgi:hypothetical protein
LSALLRPGGPLARRRDDGLGISADLFELGAQLLHRLLGGLACSRALRSPLLSARLRSNRLFARRRNLGFGIGAQLFKLGTQSLYRLFVRLGGGRTLSLSFKVLFGNLLLRCADRSARLSGDA